jgi:hypothetical protein
MSIEIHKTFPMSKWDLMDDFLKRNYREDLALRHRSHFEWQFMTGAHGGEACVLSAWDNERLVGILGYIPVDVFWGDVADPIRGAWCANWFVENEYQHGLGVGLMRELQEMFDVVLSVGASSQGSPVLKQMGWTCSPRLPRYIAVLDFERAKRMLNPSASEKELNSISIKPAVHDSCISSFRIEDYDPDWSLYPAMAFGTVRSPRYLEWRYANHQIFDYIIEFRGHAHRPAACVYRIEDAFGKHQARVGRIVDFFHPNDLQGEKDGLALIHSVLQQMSAEECVYADFICSSRIYGQTLMQAGWQTEEEGKQFLPVRLTPVEQKTRHQSLEFFTTDGLPRPDMKNMYLTKSDGDEDRPSRLPHLLHDRGEPSI